MDLLLEFNGLGLGVLLAVSGVLILLGCKKVTNKKKNSRRQNLEEEE